MITVSAKNHLFCSTEEKKVTYILDDLRVGEYIFIFGWAINRTLNEGLSSWTYSHQISVKPLMFHSEHIMDFTLMNGRHSQVKCVIASKDLVEASSPLIGSEENMDQKRWLLLRGAVRCTCCIDISIWVFIYIHIHTHWAKCKKKKKLFKVSCFQFVSVNLNQLTTTHNVFEWQKQISVEFHFKF